MKTQSNEPLERQLISIMGEHREDSYATQRKRFYELRAAAREIKERFGLQKWDNLGRKHVEFLIGRWKESALGPRTVEQKLTHFRWLLKAIGKPMLLPRTNAELGIAPGPRHTRQGKVISEEKLAEVLDRIHDPRIKAMLLLGRNLGMRFEEAALFRPGKDWQGGGRAWIKRGAKGGSVRYLNLYNDRQRLALEFARKLASADSGLIPREIPTYEKWRQYVYDQLRAAGMGKQFDATFQDCRRTYVAERMKYLIQERHLTPDAASRIVAREVGHHRTEVLQWYVAIAC
jgi:integrase-like protein